MPPPAGYGMTSSTLRSGYSAACTLAVAMPMAATKTAETAAARFIMTTLPEFSGSVPRLGYSMLALFHPRVLVGIDHLTGLVFGRPQNRLLMAVAKLIDVVRLDVLELRQELP